MKARTIKVPNFHQFKDLFPEAAQLYILMCATSNSKGETLYGLKEYSALLGRESEQVYWALKQLESSHLISATNSTKWIISQEQIETLVEPGSIDLAKPHKMPQDESKPPKTSKVSRATSKPEQKGKQKEHNFSTGGAEIIKAFCSVDPKNGRYYSNTTQRAAADELIASYGIENVLSVISLLPQTNKMPYMPTITTPVQLLDKWVQLESGLIRAKIKSNNNQKQFV